MAELKENKIKKEHSITVQNRMLTTMTGIEKVLTSCDTALGVISSEGEISIAGKDIKIEEFSVAEGTLTFSGTVNSIKYAASKTPVIKRIFK